MAGADSQPPFFPDTYLQDSPSQDSTVTLNGNGLTLSGNGSRTVAAVAADINQISHLESQLSAPSGNGSTLNGDCSKMIEKKR